jgi:CysZ protein
MLIHPKLRLFVIIPLMVNILIFGSLIGIGFGYLSAMMESLLLAIPDWLGH